LVAVSQREERKTLGLPFELKKNKDGEEYVLH
jgi:hypothetical protein